MALHIGTGETVTVSSGETRTGTPVNVDGTLNLDGTYNADAVTESAQTTVAATTTTTGETATALETSRIESVSSPNFAELTLAGETARLESVTATTITDTTTATESSDIAISATTNSGQETAIATDDISVAATGTTTITNVTGIAGETMRTQSRVIIGSARQIPDADVTTVGDGVTIEGSPVFLDGTLNLEGQLHINRVIRTAEVTALRRSNNFEIDNDRTDDFDVQGTGDV